MIFRRFIKRHKQILDDTALPHTDFKNLNTTFSSWVKRYKETMSESELAGAKRFMRSKLRAKKIIPKYYKANIKKHIKRMKWEN